MGSRYRRYAALVVAAALTGCTVGAPPGFSSGDRWTVPLVGPLENGLLLVPALVDGKGPFVFAIDPDAHVSVVDEDVVKATRARTGEGPRMLDETDTERPRFYAEVLEWKLGTLAVRQKTAQLVPAHTFDTAGRRIHGLIGRDIIADSLVFSFDREAGVVTLSTTKAFKAPAGAIVVPFSLLQSRIENIDVQPISRRLVKAQINGVPFTLHVDPGMVASQLRMSSFAKAQMPPTALQGTGVIDEVGTVHPVTAQSTGTVTLGAAKAANVVFVPYDDKRWNEIDLDGTLGLDFFAQYATTLHWHATKLLLVPRTPKELAVRAARWQSNVLASCAQPGCVKITLTDPVANKPPEDLPPEHPGLVVSVVREAAAMAIDLEVLIAVTPAAGKPPLYWLVANLPAGTDRAMTHLGPEYLGALTSVADVGLFPRACAETGACIDRVTAP